MVTRTEANQIAKSTQDAYSFDRYGEKSWAACCRMLARKGYNAQQIEAIMRSKWTRWAGDMSEHAYGKITSKDLERFLDHDKGCTLEAVNELVAGTFL